MLRTYCVRPTSSNAKRSSCRLLLTPVHVSVRFVQAYNYLQSARVCVPTVCSWNGFQMTPEAPQISTIPVEFGIVQCRRLRGQVLGLENRFYVLGLEDKSLTSPAALVLEVNSLVFFQFKACLHPKVFRPISFTPLRSGFRYMIHVRCTANPLSKSATGGQFDW